MLIKKIYNTKLRKVNIVIVDYNPLFTNALADYIYMKNDKLAVDKYHHPKKLLENISLYAKDTQMIMGYDFKDVVNGLDLADQLHNAGYTKLCLLSGKDFKKDEYPDYLAVLLKGDMIGLDKLICRINT